MAIEFVIFIHVLGINGRVTYIINPVNCAYPNYVQ